MADDTRKPVEVEAEQSWNELVKIWNEVIETKNLTDTKPSRPKMVFSIIGDSDSFVPKPWPKSTFQSALITAAKNAGDSLLIYGGRKTGISSVVYQALKDRYRLDFFDNEGKERYNQKQKDAGDKNKNETENQKQKTSSPLIQLLGIMHKNDIQTTNSENRQTSNSEKRQTKNSGKNKFEKTVSQMIHTGKSKYNVFLVELEATISRQNTNYAEVNLDLKMPVLIILLEGDKDAIKHVALAVKENLPVVIVQGTGKAADLIVDCFERDDIEKTLKRRAPLLFGESFSNEILAELNEDIDVIIKHQWLIHIFNLNADDPEKLSQIAGEAVICGWSMSNIKHSRETPGTSDTGHTKTVTKAISKEMQSQTTETLKTTERKEERRFVLNAKEKPGTSGTGKSVTSKDSVTIDDAELYELENEYLQPPGVCSPSMDNKSITLDTGHTKTVTKAISKKMQSQTSVTEATSQKKEERESKTAEKKDERRYVLNAKFMSPSSLPLHFYFQYQTLQADKTDAEDKGKKYRELLLEALKTNRIDYIQVLLDGNVIIDEDQLQKLYYTTVKCESCDLKKDGDKCLHMQWIMKQENFELTEKIIGEKANPREIRKDAENLCKKMLGYYIGVKEDIGEHEEKKQKGLCDVEDLLLWSIYANRSRISEILWQKSKNPLLSGIYCTVLLKHLSSEASDAKEFQFSEELLNHAKIFEKRSLLLMDKLYEFDTKTTLKIVGDSSTVWDITSEPMRFAHENKLYEIVAHTGCQKALNRKWYNKLPPDWWALLKPTCEKKGKFLRSPIMRFIIYYIMFVLMLISYSSYVMTSIDDNNYERVIARLWEYYTYFWAFGDLIEEGKRLFQGVCPCTTGKNSTRRVLKRLWHYYTDFWNLVDLFSYVLLIIALFVRHFTQTEEYNIPRRLFSLSLLVMYLRFLQIFFVSHRLGTQLLMIKEMLKDLIDFLYVMVIIIIAVGIYYHANLFPNHLAIFGPGSFETWSFWKVFYYPYWQLYGETFNEYLEGKDLSNCISNMTIYNLDPSQERCPREEFSVPVVSAFYFLISNLLLVNLVIAKFSYTFDAVQTNSVKLWKFQRYSLVTEFESKIPSPFNLFFYLCPFYYIYKCTESKGCSATKQKDINKRKRRRLHRSEIQKIYAGRCVDNVS